MTYTRRLLITGTKDGDIVAFVNSLTGTAPPLNTAGSVAGSVHALPLKTRYYSAEVPIWIDIIRDSKQWKDDFTSPEAAEVVRALGGYIHVLSHNSTANEQQLSTSLEETLTMFDDIIETACGSSWDGARMIVAHSMPAYVDALEDLCIEHGFELIKVDVRGRNVHGELQGIARIIESLETTEWQAVAMGDDEDCEQQEDLRTDSSDMSLSLLADHSSTASQATQLEQFDALLGAAQGIRDMRPDLDQARRRELQGRAIRRLADQILANDVA